MTDEARLAQAMVRLRNIDWLNPESKTDWDAAQNAMEKIFALSGVRSREIKWIISPSQGPGAMLMETKLLGKHLMAGSRPKSLDGYFGREAQRLTRRAAVATALLAAKSEPWSDNSMSLSVPAAAGIMALKYQPASNEAKLGAQYIRLLASGVVAVCLSRQAVYLLQMPRLVTQNGLVHCADGAAICWPGEPQQYYWRGVEIGEQAILSPASITLREINVIGGRKRAVATLSRYLTATDNYATLPSPINENKSLYAKLYHVVGGTWQVGVLRVKNPTLNKQGEMEVSYIMVPHRMLSCREAVAWTYGMSEAEYEKVHRT